MKRVYSVPVQAPASIPAAKAASDASSGLVPCAISVAATAAPSVTDPSAVISGNAKIRKLMNTPRASSERMHPIVNVPISRLICVSLSSDLRRRADPACAADELALLRPGRHAVIGQQVEYALQSFRLE